MEGMRQISLDNSKIFTKNFKIITKNKYNQID